MGEGVNLQHPHKGLLSGEALFFSMKILHAYKDFDPPIHGGMERHIALMCRYQRQWAEVEALTCSRSWRTRRIQRDGTWVTEVGEWGRIQSAPASPLYPWYLRSLPADVRVIHMPNPTAEIGCLLARPSGRIVVRYHSDVVRQAVAMKLYRSVMMRFLRMADLVIPTSQRYLDTSPILREMRDKCRVVPLGIEAEAFSTADADRVATLRNTYGGDFVLFAGRHRYYKGLSYLVEAAKSINARVVIAGEGPETPALKAQSDSMGLDVAFPGRLSQEDLVAHLHACAVFAFPSVERSEAFGIAMLEAHAAGKPVVATTLGTGVEFVNEHDKTGYNVTPRDAPALAEAINALLRDAPRRTTMGAYAQQRIRTHFTAERVARVEMDLYQEGL